jgi:hypothetical protein
LTVRVLTSYLGVSFSRIQTRIGNGGAGTLAIQFQADQNYARGLFVPLRGSYTCIFSFYSQRLASGSFLWPDLHASTGRSQFRFPDSGFRPGGFHPVPAVQNRFLSGGPESSLPVVVFGLEAAAL